MTRILLSGLATLLAMALLDGLWLGWVAKPLYQHGLGHLMADKPNWAAAAAFYFVFVAGLTVFAVLPHAAEPGLTKTAMSAALLGFVAYATYDLSNLATLKGWPLELSLIDMVWGSALSAASAVAGKAVLDGLSVAP
ncbi:MAG: DUF2177 family protein [Rhizobacter sp.]